MPKQSSSAIIGGMGVGLSLITSLVKEVQKLGGTDEDIHRLVTQEGEKTIVQIANLIVEAGKPKVRSRVIATHIITCNGHRTSELVQLGKYGWHNPAITDELFPIQPHPPVSRTIEFIECDYEPESEEALEKLKLHGLERPTHEDALQFGVEHPEEQGKRPVIFLHKPVQDPLGNLNVLVLHEAVDERRLILYGFGFRWSRHCVFAGVRK